jgi:hypothetical protein
MRWAGRDGNAYKILIRKLEGRDHLEDLDLYGKIMNLKDTRWEGMDWIHLAQDRDKWQALVNMIMNLWVL